MIKRLSITIFLILFVAGYAFAVGTWSYDAPTNTVEVYGGGVGTEATFADFVTADRDGTYTLDAARAISADPTTYSLTNAVRPVELGELQLLITLSADKIGATIELNGENVNGQAIREVIELDTAATSPVTTSLAFALVDASGVIVKGITDSTTITISQDQWGVIWDLAGDQYRIDANFSIGDGSNTTYFKSLDEAVWFEDSGCSVYLLATLSIGELYELWGRKGSYWSMTTTGSDLNFGSRGTINIYASHLHNRGEDRIVFQRGEVNIKSGQLSATYDDNPVNNKTWAFESVLTAYSIEDLYVNNVEELRLYSTPTLIDGLHVHDSERAILGNIVTGVDITGARMTSYVTADIQAGDVDGNLVTIIDPKSNISLPIIADATGIIYEKYTFNARITNKWGNPLTTASVPGYRSNVVTVGSTYYACQTDHTSGVWADDLAAGYWEEVSIDVSNIIPPPEAPPDWLTATDYVADEPAFVVAEGGGGPDGGISAFGTIDAQIVTYRKWTGTSELMTQYIYKIVIENDEYVTKTMDNMQVDEPMKLHIALERFKQPPGPWGKYNFADDYLIAQVSGF